MKQITGTTILGAEDVQEMVFIPITKNKIPMNQDGNLSSDKIRNINRDIFINCMRLKSIVK